MSFWRDELQLPDLKIWRDRGWEFWWQRALTLHRVRAGWGPDWFRLFLVLLKQRHWCTGRYRTVTARHCFGRPPVGAALKWRECTRCSLKEELEWEPAPALMGLPAIRDDGTRSDPFQSIKP